jgi:hypothetical protein
MIDVGSNLQHILDVYYIKLSLIIDIMIWFVIDG